MSSNSAIEWTDHTDQNATGQRLSAYKSAAKKVGCSLNHWLKNRAAGKKWCFQCRTWKHHSFFTVDNSRKAGLTCRCKACMSKASTASRYGLTIKAMADMAGRQRHLCLICKRRQKLVVDHDHKSTSIRGLLCNRCNVAVGLFGDNPDLLRAAIIYLEAPCG